MNRTEIDRWVIIAILLATVALVYYCPCGRIMGCHKKTWIALMVAVNGYVIWINLGSPLPKFLCGGA